MNKSSLAALTSAALFLMAAIPATAGTRRPAPASALASGSLVTATGSAAGTVTIMVPSTGSPILRVTVNGLPAGTKGVHIHTAGKCEGPAFASAGGHLNPTGHQHGKDNPAGQHLGDLPNITVAANGAGELIRPLNGNAATLAAQLFDADGAAVVVHAGPDDYRTDPSGNSGARIACAVLSRG